MTPEDFMQGLNVSRPSPDQVRVAIAILRGAPPVYYPKQVDARSVNGDEVVFTREALMEIVTFCLDHIAKAVDIEESVRMGIEKFRKDGPPQS